MAMSSRRSIQVVSRTGASHSPDRPFQRSRTAIRLADRPGAGVSSFTSTASSAPGSAPDARARSTAGAPAPR